MYAVDSRLCLDSVGYTKWTQLTMKCGGSHHTYFSPEYKTIIETALFTCITHSLHTFFCHAFWSSFPNLFSSFQLSWPSLEHDAYTPHTPTRYCWSLTQIMDSYGPLEQVCYTFDRAVNQSSNWLLWIPGCEWERERGEMREEKQTQEALQG